MRTESSVINRMIALLLCAVMVLGMLPAGAISVGAASAYGTVQSLSDGVTVHEGGAVVKAVFGGELTWVPASEAVGRYTDGWWVGIQVNAPEGVDVTGATYLSGSTEKSFWQYKDSADDAQSHYIQLWSLVNEAYLRQANLTDGLATYTWKFNWDNQGEGDETYEQTVILDIDAARTVLKDASGAQVYPAAPLGYGSVSLITPGAQVSGNGSQDVGVSFDQKITLPWVAAEPSVGRYQDGWWAGIKVTAPENMSEEQIRKAGYMSGSTAKSFWDYKDSADTDAVHFITMWVPLNNLLSGTMAPYVYQFDWNDDGIYEQRVTLSFDPQKITLTRDGTQVYPVLGQVSSYNGGTVSGSGTGNVTVVIREATLNWSPANPDINRPQSWWAGILVEAPAGMDTAALEQARFQIKSDPDTPWDTVTEVLDFKTSRDTDRSIQLWKSITPASLEQFRGSEKDITMCYRFDWDGDGAYEQDITFRVDPDGDIVLNKAEQTGFRFETENPGNVWIGDSSFRNSAVGGQGDGAVTYEIIDGDAADVDPKTGELTFQKTGTVTVRATKAADSEGFYNPAEAKYTVTAVKKDQTPAFRTTSPGSVTYKPGLTFENKVTDAVGTVTYEIVDEDQNGSGVAELDSETGMLTVQKAGTVTVKALVSGNELYNGTEITYTLTVEKAEQPDFGFKESIHEITWSPDGAAAPELTGALGDGEYIWSVSDGADVAQVSPDGRITLLKAGTFTLQAVHAGDACYKDSAPAYATVLVRPAAQTGFGFAEEKITLTYNDNDNKLRLNAEGGQAQTEVIYTLIEGDAVAVSKNGSVTVLKAGTVRVQATRPADGCYGAISDICVIEIGKADQSFTFEHAQQISEFYGLKSFETKIKPSEKNSGLVYYAVSDNQIGAAVDENGLVTFADSVSGIGEVTVTVTLQENECYNGYTRSYVIKLRYENAPEPAYFLSGDQPVPESGWYTGDVTVSAPSGYQISLNGKMNGNEWSDSVIWTAEGYPENWEQEPVVYLKNMETGAISSPIFVKELKLDRSVSGKITVVCRDLVVDTILEKLFGFSASEVIVEVTAEDTLSGTAKISYSLDEGESFHDVSDIQDNRCSFTVPARYRGRLLIRVTDAAGNQKTVGYQNREEQDIILVIDDTAPGIHVGYTGIMDREGSDGAYYASGDKVTVSVDVTDENYDLRASDPVATVNGEALSGWEVDESTGFGKLSFTLTEEGDYRIRVAFADRLGREAVYEKELRIDRTGSGIECDIEDGTYYTQPQTFVLKVTEHNFDASEMILEVSGVDSKGNALLTGDEISGYAQLAADPENWKHRKNSDVYTLELPFEKDANYTVRFYGKDALGNPIREYTAAFTLDREKPEAPVLRYEVGAGKQEPVAETILGKLFGFARETVTVTVHSSDAVSGISRLAYKLQNEDTFTSVAMDADGNYTFELEPQYRGRITAVVYDKAGHTAQTVDQKEIVVDTIAPEVEITFEGTREDAVKRDSSGNVDRSSVTAVDADTGFVYSSAVTATIRVKESNFFPDVDSMGLRITRDGALCTDWEAAGITDSGWKSLDGGYTRQLQMTRDGDYQIIAEYSDHSANTMQWESDEYANSGEHRYVSNIHTVDTTAPQITVSYGDASGGENGSFFNRNRTATIRIVDRTFRPSDFSWDVRTAYLKAGESFVPKDLTKWENWSAVEGEADTWEATVVFDRDAEYEISVTCEDIANNPAQKPFKDRFTVDKTAPDALRITYRAKDASILNTVVDSVMFGNRDAQQEVVLSMTDLCAGVDHIKLVITPEGPASATDLEMPEELEIDASGTVRTGSRGFIGAIRSSYREDAANGELTLAFDIPAQFRGKVSFRAYDRAGNYKDCGNSDIFVVDTVAPQCSVSYRPSNVVDTRDMKNLSVFDAEQPFADFRDPGKSHVMYFDQDAVATIRIEEANFDPSTVTVQVLDANGDPVKNWKQSGWTTATEEGKADIHTQTVTVSAEGDYRIAISYQDRSGNTPVEYLSNWIVVDKKAPVIEVVYSNQDSKLTHNGREYYDACQEATVTVKDRNFRADDVVVKVSAKDVTGWDLLAVNEDGFVAEYAHRAASRGNWSPYEAGTWRRVDDTYQLTLKYDADANYTFDVELCDLAGNRAGNYAGDQFTVDRTAPRDLKVTYSKRVMDSVLENISFGFYKAKVTVTVSAEDDVSGIHRFAYRYSKAPDVSGLNAGSLEGAVYEEDITYTGKQATAQFTVPGEALGRNDQLNGTFDFGTNDRSGNGTALKDSKRIVVDTISPTATVTFNESVRQANGVSYYAGNIEGTIQINEANFYSQDVVVAVTRDAKAYPVHVAWTNNTQDSHTGRFVLTEDGNYTVSVRYMDRSGNPMANYTSNLLVLDTELPQIRVTNVMANSANRQEVYGFTVTFSDTNLDVSSMSPTLTAVIKNTEGKYEITAMELGEAKAVTEGTAYTYEVENLTEDALYMLSCSVSDMSGNTTDQILLDDGKLYSRVPFSVNRRGSVFTYGDEFAADLASQYYVYSVEQDVVISEINVDPVEQYTVTLNGRELVEGSDYTTDQSSNHDEWSKRNYRIRKALFAEEGEYSIIVSSVDKAENVAYSDIKSLQMSFVVDRTAPVVTISGLETGGRYQAAEQTVTLIPSDEGGRLNRLQVIVMDSDGKPLSDPQGKDISVRFDMSGNELLEHLADNEGKVVVTVPEGLNNQVRIIVNDCAVNSEGETNAYDEVFTRVTVSQSQWIIFLANRPLFFGVIAGIVLLIAAAIWLPLAMKKRKKK